MEVTHKVLVLLGTATFKRAQTLADQAGVPLDKLLTNLLTEGLAPLESKHDDAVPRDTASR